MEENNITPEFNERAGEGLEQDQQIEQKVDRDEAVSEIWRDRFLEAGNDPDMFAETGKYISVDQGHEHLGPMMKIQADANEKKQEINARAEERTMNVVGTPEMRANAFDTIETQRNTELEEVSNEASEQAKTYYDENFAMKLEFNQVVEHERGISKDSSGSDNPGNGPSME